MALFAAVFEAGELLVFESRAVVAPWVGGDLAIGRDNPRSFPRLATPTPQVKVVRYPEHSFPISIHWPQYGRRRSHFTPRFLHAKQSSLAPVAGALLLLFLGAAAALFVVALSVVFGSAWGWVVEDDIAVAAIFVNVCWVKVLQMSM
jgi:hypothetical protein